MAPRPLALTICRRLKEERPQPAGRLRAFWFDRRGEEWGWGEAVERHKNPSREKRFRNSARSQITVRIENQRGSPVF